MNYQTLTYDLTDGVALVTMNRPDSLNALTTQMRAELQHAITTGGKEARVVVLTGAGRAFCSGQDLGDRADVSDLNLERTLKDEYEPMLKAVIECPVPVIAAVNGAAAGAGANLALVCDVVIASENAYFMQAFARIGLIPDAGGTYAMPRNMGMAKAMGAALFAEKISARQADEWGLIWEAVPEDGFEAAWRGRAEFLATGPTLAFGAIKRVVRATWDNTVEAQLDLEAKEQGVCGQTRDFKEGVLAFSEKRGAKFEGR
ncbi:MAG: enoyl-CoA hydratase/isomerase family protein [Rhodobacteraceae bacterium]|nr:enoyl-CoA hydratase/isomerase family protein [Paracoccaceae bacterium]